VLRTIAITLCVVSSGATSYAGSAMTKPPSAEPIANAMHLCIDMQNIFAPGGPSLPASLHPMPPMNGPAAGSATSTLAGTTQAQLPPLALDFVSPLDRLVPPVTIIDKPAYSAFFQSRLAAFLAEKNVGTVIITGFGDGCLRIVLGS
jgi:nicotinamidase-related amidase